MYTAADRILGRLVKVTPSSKVVGDLALALVGSNADPKEFQENPQAFDIPDSVIGFLNGELGNPPGGWPEPFRTKALQGRELKPRDADITAEDETHLNGSSKERRAALNRLLFAGPTRDFTATRDTYGDVSVLGTADYLYGLQPGIEHVIELEKGVRLIATLEAVGEPDEKGMRTVMCTLNGQMRPVAIRDKNATSDVKTAEKADPSNPGHIPAPFAGSVTVTLTEGTAVTAGDTIATIEAMKMEANITTPITGTITATTFTGTRPAQGGDLLLTITPN